MPPHHTLLFDLDGTLIDSVRLILDSYHHTLAAHGLPARPDDEWLRGIGTPLWVQFAEWKDDPERLEALIATYREYNLANHDRMVTIYPGVLESMREVKARGVQTGLVTSKNQQGAIRGLKLVGLHDLIDVMVCADDVENPKPHPEPVERAVRLLQADPASTVYIGDSIHDMRSGRAAGVRTAAVLWGPFGQEHLELAEPDYWLRRPEDIVDLVGGRPTSSRITEASPDQS
ncbi:MAG TPA: HAD-IA family hydrolase [Gemmatimonadales bacterium]|jgi:pyrophosphatase PpaX|nr:HAD-IA family hydrolase [Gemmatimonadales bacterium]